MILVISVIAVCVLVSAFIGFVEYLCDLWADATKPETPRTDAFLKATTPCLRLADYGARDDENDSVPEGLGQSRKLDPGPMRWVALPENPDKWLDAVAK
jgi:hypothetical protein